MNDSDAIRPGLAGTADLTVADRDTAIAMGSGDVPVLATPRVVALIEEAACAALGGQLSPDVTSVGVRIEVDHLRATRVGGAVTATATLTAVNGRKLDFDVTVKEDNVEVAKAWHRRIVAPRDAFPPPIAVRP